MKKRELNNLGIHDPTAIKAAYEVAAAAAAAGTTHAQLRELIKAVVAAPDQYLDHAQLGALAQVLAATPEAPRYEFRESATYASWGSDIDQAARDQMHNACRLPVTVAAALMPDAHVGYGLPIGGVLATENAVIPYAVGVDIACRVKLTVFDLPPERLVAEQGRFENILERETNFGMGGKWRPNQRPQHEVLDENWDATPVTARLRDTAWAQLGTSGSGNHFVEFGEIEFGPNALGVAPGRYVGVVSHSGSRGAGAKVCDHYSRLAQALHPHLPAELRHLAWLPMDGDGAEYWAAMELMGKYAHANHDVIHRKIAKAVNERVVLQVENHHNFAWKEQHGGREVIVHRKGATPAGKGALGYIPGSMVAPGYLVEGLGEPTSLDSASHGAGRQMSRTKARKETTWSDLRKALSEHGVALLSAGLDETPFAYKDIESVMAAQAGLVRRLAKFSPRLVKMAPDGERPED